MSRLISRAGVSLGLLFVAIATSAAEPRRLDVPPAAAAAATKIPSSLAEGQVAPVAYEVGLEKLEATRASIGERLTAAQASIVATQETASGQPSEELQRVVELLKRLDSVLKETAQSNEQLKDLRSEKVAQEASLKALRTSGPTEPKPYSFLLLDRLRDELRREENRTQSIQDMAEAAAVDLEQTRKEQVAKEHARRAAQERLGKNTDSARISELRRAFEIADLEADLTTLLGQLGELKVAREKVAAELQEVRVTYLREKVAAIDKEDLFTKEDLDRQITELDKQEDDVKRELVMCEALVEARKESWLEAQRRMRESSDTTAAGREEVEAERLAWENPKRRIEVLNQRVRRLAEMRAVWQRRFQLAKQNAAASEIAVWQTESRTAVDQLQRESRLISTRIDELRKDLATLESKIHTVGAEANQERAVMQLNRQKDLIQQRISINETNIVHAETARRLHERLIDESAREAATASAAEQLANGWQKASSIWSHELLAIDDHSITVRKIVEAVGLLLIGLLLSRIASTVVGRRVLPRLGYGETASTMLQSVVFYTLLMFVIFFALSYVNVPLTTLTAFGGALLLVVGFGARNHIDNFISGSILRAERPIRAGDTIEVNGLHAVVEQIGAVGARLKSDANLDVVLPNRSFLESGFVNWSRGDNLLRASVGVDVACGPPPREVERLLLQAAAEHPRLEAEPPPHVWFAEFSGDSLRFELYFWVRADSQSEQRHIESDMRFRIEELLREASMATAADATAKGRTADGKKSQHNNQRAA